MKDELKRKDTVLPQMRRSVTQSVRLCDALGEAMQCPLVGQWLDQPNEIERGKMDLFWQVVEGLRSGSHL